MALSPELVAVFGTMPLFGPMTWMDPGNEVNDLGEVGRLLPIVT